MPIRATFCKDERLKRERHIETLFRSGKAFSVFPVRIIWLSIPRNSGEWPTRAGFVAPKKKFKHAVSRNRLKRLMREAWRLQKGDFYMAIPANLQLHLFFIFADQKPADYSVIHAAIGKGLNNIAIALSHDPDLGATPPQPTKPL